jgi:hypothetical protein
MRFVRIVLFATVLVVAPAAPALAAESIAQTSSCTSGTACAGAGDTLDSGWGVKMNLTPAKRWPGVLAVWIVLATPVYLSARRRLLPGQLS